MSGLDICSECGVVGEVGMDLLRCSKQDNGECLVIQLCICCLARVNPHIPAAFFMRDGSE
jgi:hypothetical protein